MYVRNYLQNSLNTIKENYYFDLTKAICHISIISSTALIKNTGKSLPFLPFIIQQLDLVMAE